MSRRKTPVAVVVAATLVIVTTLVLGTFGALSHARDRDREMARLRREMAVQTVELADGLALPIWNIDRAQIDKILDGMAATPAIFHVSVTAAGKTHARIRDSGWNLVRADGPVSTKGFIVEIRPIMFSGERIGSVRIVATFRFVETELRRSIASIVGAIFATELLLVLAAGVSLWLSVIRPLKKIERYAAAVSARSSENLIVSGAGFPAELENLRGSIETMVGLLESRYAELERAERALRTEQTFTDTAINAMMGLFFVREYQGRYVRWNEYLEDLLELADPAIAMELRRRSDTPQRFAMEIVHPDDQPIVKQKILDTFEIGHAESEVRIVLSTPPEIRHFVIHSKRMDVDGKAFIVTTGIDVTDRRRAELEQHRLQAAVAQSALEWRETFDSVSTPIVITDGGGRVRRLNASAAELAQQAPGDVVGRPIGAVAAGPWTVAAELIGSFGDGGDRSGAEAHDGAGRTWQVHINRLVSAESEGSLIIVFWEVTGIVALQESLRRSEKMSAMGSLVAGVAHEVRNPLFGISATLDSYESELQAPEYQELAASLRSQVQRLAKLMQELLDYGKPVLLSIEQDSIHPVVREAVMNRTSLALQAGVVLEDRVPSTLQPLLLDSSRLRQVFENLIENAVQHAPRGGTVRVSADEIDNEGRRWIECRIEDDGRGFAPADLDAVFEPFYTRREGGTGLGLSIVQRIVDEHSGKIFAGNRPGGGAVVTLRLPVAEPAPPRPRPVSA